MLIVAVRFFLRHSVELLLLVEQMSSTDTVITRDYTYDGNYGVHTVNVRGFNSLNSHTVSANVDVLEWPCQSINVTVHGGFSDSDLPFTAENNDGFVVSATFAVDCMKSEQYTAQWDLLNSWTSGILDRTVRRRR